MFTSAHPASSRSPARRRLWFGVFVPPSAWAAQGLASVVIVVHGCASTSPAKLRAILVVIMLAALALCGSAGLVGFRSYRRSSRGDGQGSSILRAEGRDQDEMLALLAVLNGLLFAIAVVWAGLPSLLVRDLCEVFR
jgi:hypothetical protein